MAVQRTTTYKEQSRILLAQAYEELANGDLAQASKKGWGAAAQMLKAIADERGWPHEDPPDLHTVMDKIFLETEDEEMLDHFCAALFMGFSYCDGAVSSRYIEDNLGDVGQFIGRAEGLLRKTVLG